MRMDTVQWGCLGRSLGCFLMLVSLFFGSVGLTAVLYEFTGAYSRNYESLGRTAWSQILIFVISVPGWLFAIHLIGGGRANVSSNVHLAWVIAGVIVSIVILAFLMLLYTIG